MAVRNFLGRDTKPLADQPREYRGVALAGVLHIEPELQGLVAGKFQERAFDRRTAGMFEHAADAQPAVFAALLRLAPALLEALVLGEFQRFVEDRLEVAGIDDRTDLESYKGKPTF